MRKLEETMDSYINVLKMGEKKEELSGLRGASGL